MTRGEKIIVWSSTAAVAVTGFVYAAMQHLMQPADEWALVNHPLQPLVLKLHILTAPVLVFAVGLIAMRHILPHLRSGLRRARRSGIASLAVIVPMVLSGYLIQAVTSAPLLTILGWLHLATGAAFAVSSLAHAVATRRRRRQDARTAPRTEPEPIPIARRAS